MTKIITTIFVLFMLISCGDAGKTDTHGDSSLPNATDLPTETSTSPDTEVVESNVQYDNDWDRFKKAVISKDIKGVSAFASSDAVDAEALLMVMSDEIFLNKLKGTSFKDLTINDAEEGENLEFHAQETAMDEDGNEVGSAISIFFTKGETGLELDYFIAAG